jgi:hypothetical protein
MSESKVCSSIKLLIDIILILLSLDLHCKKIDISDQYTGDTLILTKKNHFNEKMNREFFIRYKYFKYDVDLYVICILKEHYFHYMKILFVTQ